KEVKLNKSRWQSYMRRSKEYEGWHAALMAEFGNDVIRFVSESRLLDETATTVDEVRKILGEVAQEGDAFETEIISQEGENTSVKAIHLRSGLARNHVLPASLFESTEFKRFAEVHAELKSTFGRPPFRVSLKDRHEEAEGILDIHEGVLNLAK